MSTTRLEVFPGLPARLVDAYEQLATRRLAADRACGRMLRHLVERSAADDDPGHPDALGPAGLSAVGRMVDRVEARLDAGDEISWYDYRDACHALHANKALTQRSRALAPDAPAHLVVWKAWCELIEYDRCTTWGFHPEAMVSVVSGLLHAGGCLDPGDTAAQLLCTRSLDRLRGRSEQAGERWEVEIFNPYTARMNTYLPVALQWFEQCTDRAARL